LFQDLVATLLTRTIDLTPVARNPHSALRSRGFPHPVRKGSAFPKSSTHDGGYASCSTVSKDTPAYYITSVTNMRLPVFQKANMKDIEFLKKGGYDSSLEKLRHQQGRNRYRYSLWDHHSNLKSITDEDVFIQKVNYIHQNPVRAGLIEDAKTYR
jgi:hypothetical protein